MTFFDQATDSFCLPTETKWAPTPGDHMNQSWVGSFEGQPSYVLRLCHPDRTRDDIETEHNLLSRLVNTLPVHVPHPLSTPEGTTCVTHKDQQVTVYTYIPGAHPDFSKTADVESAARLLAACHAALWETQDEFCWLADQRPSLAVETWPGVRDLLGDLQSASTRAPIPARLLRKTVVESILQRAEQAMGHLEALRSTVHLIHGDINPTNLLASEGEITTFLDWDECRWDLPIYDLTALLDGMPDKDAQASALDAYDAAVLKSKHLYANDMKHVRQCLPAAHDVSRFHELLIMLKSDRNSPGYLEKLLTQLAN